MHELRTIEVRLVPRAGDEEEGNDENDRDENRVEERVQFDAPVDKQADLIGKQRQGQMEQWACVEIDPDSRRLRISSPPTAVPSSWPADTERARP
jgi:hypothetical protein